jgi:hypothetical protein
MGVLRKSGSACSSDHQGRKQYEIFAVHDFTLSF